MKLSETGISDIARHEKFMAKRYLDQGGKWTIGYGHLLTKKENRDGLIFIGNHPVGVYDLLTKNGGRLLLEQDCLKAVKAVNKGVSVKLSQRSFDALVSLVFNIGRGAFRSSTLLKRLNEKKYVLASRHFTDWCFVGGKPSAGLLTRRLTESKDFLLGTKKQRN